MRRPNRDHVGLDWRIHSLAADFQLLDVWRFPIEISADVPFETFLRFFEERQGTLGEGNTLTAKLFRFRTALGELFGWDREGVARPLPQSGGAGAAVETTLRARLQPEDFERDHSAAFARSGASRPFESVYEFEREATLEIQNATVHALMHLGCVELAQGSTLSAAAGAAWAAGASSAGGGAWAAGASSAAGSSGGAGARSVDDTAVAAGATMPSGTEGTWSPQMAVYVQSRGWLGRIYMALITPFRHGIVYPAMMRSIASAWPEYLDRQPS